MSDSTISERLKQIHASIEAASNLQGVLLEHLSEFREWRRAEAALCKLEREEQFRHAQAMAELLAGLNAAQQAKQQAEQRENENERKRKAEQPETDPFQYTPVHKYT